MKKTYIKRNVTRQKKGSYFSLMKIKNINNVMHGQKVVIQLVNVYLFVSILTLTRNHFSINASGLHLHIKNE